MAGETLLSALLKGVFDKLSSPILEEFGLLWAFNKELDNLGSTAATIQAVLLDAEKRQLKEAAVKDWVRKIKDVGYDIEDIFDDLETEALRRKVEAQEETMFHDRIFNKVRDFFSPSNTLVFRIKMGHKIQKMQERLDAIADERLKFHFREGVADGQTATIVRRQTSTHSRVTESEIYGRDADKAKIVELLLDMGNAEEDVSIVSIIGMGGLGKTTLAKLAYNDDRVQQHFDLRMWVCVSLDFDVKRLTKEIIEAAINNKCDLLSMDLLQFRLQAALSGKRFLLVLDDVWNEEPNRWNNLKTLLRGSVGGCKILATTRNERVAMIMGTRSTHHHLSALKDDDCWSLFKQRAYEPGQEEEHPNLVSIGKEIVKKCRGLPLAAEALGGLMSCKKEEREWLSVKDSEVWNLDEDDKEILPALRLSYDNLPSHLKQCFAYCSIFPKGVFTEKDTLIQQWMAQGFLQSSSMRSKTMEEIGNDYFNDLVQRSLFQQVDEKDYYGDYFCQMHDLIHDLAAFVAGAECSVLKNSRAMSIHQTTRHSSLVRDDEAMLGNLQVLSKANKLRTFLLYGLPPDIWHPLKINLDICLNFRQVRVLDLSMTGIVKLPASIGNLKKLRYLDLSRTDIKSFPKTFCNLHNLQTLKLLGCLFLKELPQDMRKMISLRYVEIDPSSNLKISSKEIGRLSWFQSFTVFTVGKEIGSRIDELKSQNHLQGDLKITMLQNVTNSKEAEEANLKEKRNLRSLTLSWEYPVGGDDASTREEIDESVIEGLQPFSGLENLLINNYMGVRFPSWLMDSSLPNLVELSLTKCIRCECLPQLAQLPFLKVLHIDGLDAIKFINMVGCESSQGGIDAIMGFPLLELLRLENMHKLEGWSTSRVEEGQEREQLLFPRLRILSIDSCPKLVSFPRLPPTLETLVLFRNNEMLLRSLVAVSSFASLFHLCICGYPEMTSLPEGLLPNHHLLKSLVIEACPKLVILPETVGNLTSLEELHIMYCPGMMSLPASLQQLTQLHTMSIEGCPHLKRRCKKRSGKDWHKIAHIPQFTNK